MKKLILFLFLLGWATVASAEKYYVYIDKIGHVDAGQEAGQNAKGDVVTVAPYTPQYKPTPAELSRYQIIVMDLTDSDMTYLMAEDTKMDADGQPYTVTARKRKIDLNTNIAKSFTQEKVLSTKENEDVIKEAVVDKVVAVTAGGSSVE
jgi:hypothetical protein